MKPAYENMLLAPQSSLKKALWNFTMGIEGGVKMDGAIDVHVPTPGVTLASKSTDRYYS